MSLLYRHLNEISKGRALTESTEDVAAIDILDDIAALARKLAEKEPFKSASGPDALQAFAMHLEDMVTNPGQDDRGRAGAVTVAVRSRRKKSD